MKRPILPEQHDQEIIKPDKIILPVIELPKIESWEQSKKKTGFTVSVTKNSTKDILDGTFFITLTKHGKSGVDAVVRARGYPDMKIENGQAGQDFIFRCAKNYEIRIADIGVNTNFESFFIREIE